MSISEKEVGEMPVWQNHEHRITNLENVVNSMRLEFVEVKNIINKGNDEQKTKLDKIDNALMTEFFHRKRTTHDTKLGIYAKIAGVLVGTGSVLYIIIEKLINMIGG